MLPARALAFAIMVSVFVSIISLALIQYSELSHILRAEQTEQDRILRNLSSGMDLVLGSDKDMAENIIDLFDNKKDSIAVSRLKWGFFNIGYVKAFVHNLILQDSIQRHFLIGVKKNKIDNLALNFPFSHSVITLCGNTSIIGDVALPKEGMKSGSIGGFNYSRSQFFSGKHYLPNATPPIVNRVFLNHIFNLYTTPTAITKSIPKLLNRSFSEKTLFIEGDSLMLDNCKISGNIVIRSKRSIIIGTNCQITDAILIAPKIHFLSGFRGSLQAIAFEQIITESQTSFYYPSVLALLENKFQNTKPLFIRLNSNTLLEGLLLFSSESFSPIKTYISIGDKAIVHGQVFIDRFGSLELKGKVYGSVTTSSFYRSIGGSLYDNVIVDGTIDISHLSPYYLNPIFLQDDRKYGLMKMCH
jgi:hypothetical protein